MSDMAKDLRLLKADGSRSQNMRCHESTKRVYGLLKQLGGPKTTLFLTANFGMISQDTIDRNWRDGLFTMNPGVNEPTVE